jgi:non-specific serine/threonine protein kinase
MAGETLGHYRIEKRIGAGGMGMVYAARDTRLERLVALKVIHEGFDEPGLRERMWREARAAAALSHPAICQVHEIGEDAGRLFIVMEMLDGQTLEDRLLHGALDLDEVLRIGLVVLDGLSALHRRDLIHRDIKPSNVFLLDDGRVKLLDFGLVRPATPVPAEGGVAPSALTRPGLGIGSPGYMAPEQVLGEDVDPRADLFSLAVVLHEAASGQRVFRGGNAIEIMHAALRDTPPPLRGSGRLEALGHELARAMAREREDRFATADDMAAALRSLQSGSMGIPEIAHVRLTRLAVLPFRMLRPDPEREFLGPSLADAIAMSLAGIRSLVVRSTMASAQFTGTGDIEEIQKALDVDVVLSGTLLVSGERCRAAAQLVEVPSGRVRWSEQIDVSSGDIFELQDQLTRRIVESLKLPLTREERGELRRDVPANAVAYELYLRGSQNATMTANPAVGRDLLVRAIEADPQYAPAWARLGHVYRLLGKYFPGNRKQNYQRACDSVNRALELNPALPLGHLVLAQIDLDLGRTERALDNLLSVVEKNPNDPLGYHGLVTAFRYAGMTDASFEAHRTARELDPEIRTSIEYTLVILGKFEAAVKAGGDYAWEAVSWVFLGLENKVAEYEAFLARIRTRAEYNFFEAIYHAMKRDRRGVERIAQLEEDFPDPEGRSFYGLMLHLAGSPLAIPCLEESVRGGFYTPDALRMSPLDGLRGDLRFEALMREAEARAAATLEAIGPRWQAIMAQRLAKA